MSRIKICGITDEAELTALSGFPVALYGLWHRCGGRHDLDLAGLRRLGRDGAGQGGARPCLVSFEADPARLAETLAATRIPVLQLHGFCLPAQLAAIVQALRALPHRVEVLKVLHMTGARCAESALIGAYRDSGADGFILDAFQGRHAVGSTGQRVCLNAARALAADLRPHPVLLAGGVDAALLAGLPGREDFAGFDIDSAARREGRISARALAPIFAALAPPQEGASHAA